MKLQNDIAHQHLQPMTEKNLPFVLEIEKQSFDEPWTEEDFRKCLAHPGVIRLVYESTDRVVRGFMIYELHKSELRFLNIAVAPEVRRTGIGTFMLSRVIGMLEQQRRQLWLNIVDTNLIGQLFFSSCGMRAKRVDRGHFPSGADAIRFEFNVPSPVEAGNRISKYFKS